METDLRIRSVHTVSAGKRIECPYSLSNSIALNIYIRIESPPSHSPPGRTLRVQSTGTRTFYCFITCGLCSLRSTETEEDLQLRLRLQFPASSVTNLSSWKEISKKSMFSENVSQKKKDLRPNLVRSCESRRRAPHQLKDNKGESHEAS